MTTVLGRGWAVVAATFVVALMLTALPLPDWAAPWRPAWAALVLVYWCMAVPEKIGVMAGWCVGILLDVLTGTLLGQHALALAVTAFAAHKLHRRVRVLPIWQQAISVFGLMLFYQVLVLWVSGVQGQPVPLFGYWTSPLISMALWPWLYIILRDLRRRYRVA